MTSKLFKVGGVSKGSKCGYKVRFANDMTRVKILAKADTDVNMLELPKAMTKGALVTFLKTSALYLNKAYQEAIDVADAKYNGTSAVVKAKKTKAVAKVATKPSMADIKARASKAVAPKTEPVAE
jgi:hypothetical protein